jgi:hypothetical protein
MRETSIGVSLSLAALSTLAILTRPANSMLHFDVRFGSQADICAATSDVCFTPNSDRKSGHARRKMVMSALPPKADMCGAAGHVCYGPKADIRVGYARFKINAMRAAKLP